MAIFCSTQNPCLSQSQQNIQVKGDCNVYIDRPQTMGGAIKNSISGCNVYIIRQYVQFYIGELKQDTENSYKDGSISVHEYKTKIADLSDSERVGRSLKQLAEQITTTVNDFSAPAIERIDTDAILNSIYKGNVKYAETSLRRFVEDNKGLAVKDDVEIARIGLAMIAEARFELEKAKTLALEAVENAKTSARPIAYLARLSGQMADISNAVKYARTASEKLSSSKDGPTSEIYRWIGDAFLDGFLYREALEAYNQSIKANDFSKLSANKKANIYMSLSALHNRMLDYKQSHEFANQILREDLFSSFSNEDQLSYWNNRALAFLNSGCHSVAADYAKFVISNGSQDPVLVVFSTLTLARALAIDGKSEDAYSEITRSYQTAQKIFGPDSWRTAQIATYLAEIVGYWRRKTDLDMALKSALQAKATLENTQNSRAAAQLGITLAVIARLHIVNGDIASSKEYIQQATAMSLRLPSPSQAPIVWRAKLAQSELDVRSGRVDDSKRKVKAQLTSDSRIATVQAIKADQIDGVLAQLIRSSRDIRLPNLQQKDDCKTAPKPFLL